MSCNQPDLTLLRRACAPCTLRQFCQHTGHSGAGDVSNAGGPVGRVRALLRGETLFRAGQNDGAVYAVRAGALKTTTLTDEGGEHVLGFHLPGELVGLDSLVTGAHFVEAIALMDTQVCAVTMDALLARSVATPDLGRELLHVVGCSAMSCHTHVDVLLRRQATERIALFLHGLLARLHLAGQQGAELVLPMSREDVGHYLGLALETVSRGFTRLQDDGIISVDGRSVRILDSDQLRRVAQLPESGGDHEPPLQRQA
jgi:CRP/FNR family transcriptional regulator, anaerobic regulatory protein